MGDSVSGDNHVVLGVPKHATDTKSRRACTALEKQYHPEQNHDRNIHADASFKRNGEANTVLRDPRKRNKYDSSLIATQGSYISSRQRLSTKKKRDVVKSCKKRPVETKPGLNMFDILIAALVPCV